MAAIVHTPPWTVPGPRPLPLIGRTMNAFRFIDDPIGHSRHLFAQYGAIVSLAEGGGTNIFSPYAIPGTVFVYGPELIRHVRTPHEAWGTTPLSGRLYPTGDVPPRKQALKHFLAEPWGLAGETHRQQRRIVTPAFHKQHIAAYRDDMVAIAQSVFRTWQPGAVVDLSIALRTLASRIATKTLFGEDRIDDTRSAGYVVQQALATIAQPVTSLVPLDLPGLPYHRFLHLITRFDTEMRAIIRRKQAAGHDNGDVLGMLIGARAEESGAVLTEDELIAWVGSLFGAGHETSSLAMGWTVLLLGQHPAIAADLVDELQAVLHGDAPTVEQLGQLPLLEHVINESMRLLPPAPFTWRIAHQPIEIGGYLIPQNSEVVGSIYQTHHMPELYAEPERFHPRRWETITPGTWEYMPFSAGPRRCIGAEFAMLEIKIVLAMLLQRFRLQFVPRVPIDRYGLITMGPKHGLPMRISTQDRQFTKGVGGVRGNVRDMVELPT